MAVLIDLGIAKTNKYASRESGDTVEVVERPTGGFSVVLADGQGSGRAAKALSLLVTARACAMLRDGVRDGATARGVADAVFATRHGQVSATLDILTVDTRAEAVMITRFATTPLIAGWPPNLERLACAAGPLGVRHLARPEVRSWELRPGFWAAIGTDGVAGIIEGLAIDEEFPREGGTGGADTKLDAQSIADRFLLRAVEQDGRRPRDDMSVVVLRVGEHDEEPRVRRMTLRVPLP